MQHSITVTDRDTIDFLENQEHITTYKAMQLINGELFPPMAEVIGTKKNGTREEAAHIGE